jgi:hypothetical protein
MNNAGPSLTYDGRLEKIILTLLERLSNKRSDLASSARGASSGWEGWHRSADRRYQACRLKNWIKVQNRTIRQ